MKSFVKQTKHSDDGAELFFVSFSVLFEVVREAGDGYGSSYLHLGVKECDIFDDMEQMDVFKNELLEACKGKFSKKKHNCVNIIVEDIIVRADLSKISKKKVIRSIKLLLTQVATMHYRGIGRHKR